MPGTFKIVRFSNGNCIGKYEFAALYLEDCDLPFWIHSVLQMLVYISEFAKRIRLKHTFETKILFKSQVLEHSSKIRPLVKPTNFYHLNSRLAMYSE